MIEWWIDIPNLQTVSLPKSFGEIETKSITSIIMNMNEWIDVSRKLAKLVKRIIDKKKKCLKWKISNTNIVYCIPNFNRDEILFDDY